MNHGGINTEAGMDGSNGLDQGESTLDARLVKVTALPLVDTLGAVLLDGLSVRAPICSEGLDQHWGLGEDFRPHSNIIDVVIHVFTS